jgi:hypothetical protein
LLASKQVFLSPFGGAPEDGEPLTECARIIHDESFPRNGGISVNAATSNIPLEIHHDGVTLIARWELEVASRYPDDVVMMTGDVAGAFRHVLFNCWFCGYFPGYIPELDIIVVNLCFPFGGQDHLCTITSRGKQSKRYTIADRFSRTWCIATIIF